MKLIRHASLWAMACSVSRCCWASKGHSLQWIQRHAKDRWVQRAHEQMYRSRAAFKLKQLDAKYKLFNRSSVVLDLGCYAGGWSQVAVQRTAGREALVVGVDKVLMEPLEGHYFVQGDIEDVATVRQVEELLAGRQATVVLSDLAPKMIGSAIDDHVASVELSKKALRWALKFLRAEGCLVLKVFQGGALQNFKAELLEHFAKVRTAKPKASRSESVEVYLVCQSFLGRL